jgi:hypothetical protein
MCLRGAIFLPASLVTSAWRALLPQHTAWIPYIFEHGVLGHEPGSLYLLRPLMLLPSSLPLAARRLRETYPIVEPTYPLAPRAVRDLQEYDDETRTVREEDWQGTSTHLCDRIGLLD